MLTVEMKYYNNTLYVILAGKANNTNLRNLRKKISYLKNEFLITNIVISVKDVTNMDTELVYNFLEEYDNQYGKRMLLVE
jgi:hypothetical protein